MLDSQYPKSMASQSNIWYIIHLLELDGLREVPHFDSSILWGSDQIFIVAGYWVDALVMGFESSQAFKAVWVKHSDLPILSSNKQDVPNYP